MKKRWIIGIIITTIVSSWCWHEYQLMVKYGVYTVAKVTKWESAEQGSDVYMDVYYQGRIFKGHADGGYGKKIGSFYYVRIFPTRPTRPNEPEEEVPLCILNKPLPKNGWRVIPNCVDSSSVSQ